jgi:hypothetical protein
MYLCPDDGFIIGKDFKIYLPSFNLDFSRKNKNESSLFASYTLKNENPYFYINKFFHRYKIKSIYYKDTIIDDTKTKELTKFTEVYNASMGGAIEFPENENSLFYPFFSSLDNIKKTGELISILHYGDSQIEGDRISASLREKFQKKFGGSGVGLIPVVMNSAFYMSLKHKISDNWDKYSLSDESRYYVDHSRFGVMLSFARFSPVKYNPENAEIYESYIDINKSFLAFPLARKFNTCKMFYGFNNKPFIVEVYKNNSLYDADIIVPVKQISSKEWVFNEEQTAVSIRFRGEDSPDIYGISFNSASGVSVENIPLRGSKGFEFTRNDADIYKKMASMLNVKFVIFQFGINAVIEVDHNYEAYEQKMVEQLMFIKNCIPDAQILVVSVSDMATKHQDDYESYPNIEKIIIAQHNAAFITKCAFWNLFAAMGGRNSMKTWVYSDPPLAQKDFIHFTFDGANKVGEMLYEAIINEYEKYENALAGSPAFSNDTIYNKSDSEQIKN